eukprot:2479076-Pyramimonas_sp.AAC.1
MRRPTRPSGSALAYSFAGSPTWLLASSPRRRRQGTVSPQRLLRVVASQLPVSTRRHQSEC